MIINDTKLIIANDEKDTYVKNEIYYDGTSESVQVYRTAEDAAGE